MVRSSIVIVAALGLAGASCGSSSSNAPGDQGGGDDTGSATDDTGAPSDDTGSLDETPSDDTSTDDYPAGPYGIDVGDVLADVQLLGYAHYDPTTIASTSDYAPSSLSQIRKTVTVPYGVLHVGEFW